jgi:uncharacterized Zn finger protein
MQCPRCAGLRVPELIYEGGTKVLALRCVHCGDVIDRVIVLNRQRRRYPKPSQARTPIYGSDRWKRNNKIVLS